MGIEKLIDREGKAYGRKNLKYLTHDIEDEIFKDALLLKTPVVRNGRDANGRLSTRRVEGLGIAYSLVRICTFIVF